MALYCACEPDDFLFNGPITDSTSSDNFDSTYGIRYAFRCEGFSSSSEIVNFGTFSGDFWIRFRFKFDNSTPFLGDVNLISLKNAAGSSRAGIRSTTDERLIFFVRDSSDVVQDYYTLPITASLELTVDIQLSGLGTSSGKIGFYIDDVKVFEEEDINLQSTLNINSAVFGGVGSFSSRNPYISEVIWGDEPTIEARVALAAPSGNGFYQDGDGGFGRVDETLPDGSAIIFDAPNERSSFTQSTLAAVGDFTIRNVQVNSFARYTGPGGADDIRAFLRIGGADYDNPTALTDLSAGYESYQANWLTNPSTGSGWTVADAISTAMEFGIKTES